MKILLLYSIKPKLFISVIKKRSMKNFNTEDQCIFSFFFITIKYTFSFPSFSIAVNKGLLSTFSLFALCFSHKIICIIGWRILIHFLLIGRFTIFLYTITVRSEWQPQNKNRPKIWEIIKLILKRTFRKLPESRKPNLKLLHRLLFFYYLPDLELLGGMSTSFRWFSGSYLWRAVDGVPGSAHNGCGASL